MSQEDLQKIVFHTVEARFFMRASEGDTEAQRVLDNLAQEQKDATEHSITFCNQCGREVPQNWIDTNGNCC